MGRLTRRRKRRQTTTAHRLHKPKWIDPFPTIPGTLPEKQIFAALVQRGIYFVFQDSLPEWEAGMFSTLDLPQFIPDFTLPEYKVIIDPFGDFHHSLPEQVARDAEKAAVYQSTGYAFYHPWSSDLERRGAHATLTSIVELHAGPQYPLPEKDKPFYQQGYRLGPYVGLGSTSVAAANRRRRRARQPSLRIRRPRG